MSERFFQSFNLIIILFFTANIALASDFKNIPIQNLLESRTTNDYRSYPIDFKNKKFKEKLVDIKSYKIKGLSFYNENSGLNFPYNKRLNGSSKEIYLRQSVAKKLRAVNNYLKAYKVNVFVLDGYRSYKLQACLWQFYLDYAKSNHPKFTDLECINFALTYCSNPQGFSIHDSSSWYTHSTGASVDLTLQDSKTGDLLFMGSIFDDPSDISHTSYFETTESTNLSDLAARQNRRILYAAMTKVGFTNYPNEWWHYDWGNQMWLMDLNYNTKVKGAFYGAIEKP